MTPNPRSRGLGYESPTEHTVASALATNHLIHRLNELQRTAPRQNETAQHHVTMDEVVSKSEVVGHGRAVSIKDRIACFQWTWFTSTMATGGIANVLASSTSPRPSAIKGKGNDELICDVVQFHSEPNGWMSLGLYSFSSISAYSLRIPSS